MTTSTLDPDNIPGADRQLGIGHGTDSLGPSDISDTGSDVQGGLRAIEENLLGLDQGTTEDPDSHSIDASRDTDDSTGTGESSTAGRHSDVRLYGDIGFDRVDRFNPDEGANSDQLHIDPSAPRRTARQSRTR